MKRTIFILIFAVLTISLAAQNKMTYPLYMGKVGVSSGKTYYYGITSGLIEVKAPDVAGTGTVFQFPANNGTNGYVLTTNGSGVTSWAAAPTSITYPSAGIPISTGSAWGTSVSAVSATELGYLDNVTSAIQTQFTGKVNVSDTASMLTPYINRADTAAMLGNYIDETALNTALSSKTNTTDVRAVQYGGTGRSTSTTAYGLIAAGTTATGVQQTVPTGSAGDYYMSNGAGALPSPVTPTALEDIAVDIEDAGVIMTADSVGGAEGSYTTGDDFRDGMLLKLNLADSTAGTKGYATFDDFRDGIALKQDIVADVSSTEISYLNNTTSEIQAQINTASNVGFTIIFDNQAFATPVDNTTYYYGIFPTKGLSTNAGLRQVLIPVNCTLVGYTVVTQSTAAASNETGTLSVRINNITDVQLSNVITWAVGGADVNNYFSSSALNTAITAGDKLEMKLLTPTWATDATQLLMSTVLYFKNR